MDKLQASRFATIDTKTVAITSFRIVEGSQNQLAEVVASVTGPLSGLPLLTKLHAALDEQAIPVSNSFRWLDDNVGKTTRMISGFVSMSPAVKTIKSRFDILKSGYRLMAKNMYMDDQDHAWELKSGDGGEYLVRTSSDELPTVLQAAKQRGLTNVSRLTSSVTNLTPVDVHTGEFAAFINHKHQLDYGFVVGASKSTGDIAIVSHSFNDKVMVHPSLIIESTMYTVPASVQSNPRVGPLPGATDTKKLKASATSIQIDYWKKAYVYSPEYVNKLIEQVEGMAAA